jgi:hypothetical protein
MSENLSRSRLIRKLDKPIQFATDKLFCRSLLVTSRLADVGTESVGSSVAETDAFTRQQFTLYRGIVERDKSLLGGQ